MKKIKLVIYGNEPEERIFRLIEYLKGLDYVKEVFKDISNGAHIVKIKFKDNSSLINYLNTELKDSFSRILVKSTGVNYYLSLEKITIKK